MNSLVVYESLWGNTAAIAHAIAEGLEPGSRAYYTDEAPAEAAKSADLIVAGSPVLAFMLPSEKMRADLAAKGEGPTPPDVSHVSMRSWLEELPAGRASFASFETRISWSPRGATSTIDKRMKKLGYVPLDTGKQFLVTDRYGPLADGEIERAREWGAELARKMQDT